MKRKANKLKEFAVDVTISGKAVVFTRAASEEEAVEKVNRGDWYGAEIGEWSAEDAISAEVNE